MVRCAAKSKQTGQQCRHAAMRGKQVCYIHGGASPGRPPVHGRYSKSLAKHTELQALYEALRDDPQLMETKNEIALLRAYLGTFVEQYGATLHPKTLDILRGFVGDITSAVERRHRQLYGITINMRDWQTWVTRVLAIIRETYGEDERYVRVVEQLRNLGDVATPRQGTGTAGPVAD